MSNKTKQHTVYKLANGKRICGVTTILSVLSKPALYKWHNDMGLQGIVSSKYVDDKADIGTCAHYLIQMYLQNQKPELSEYSKDTIDKAENSYLKFLEWEKNNKISNVKCEIPLVSEKYQYGGSIDIYGEINGVKTLIDIKTSKSGIWPEMKYQVMAYKQLLEENNYPVTDVYILRVGRSEDEGFEVQKIENFEQRFEMFKLCLQIYNLKKELE